MKIFEFLEEDNGGLSSMRLIAVAITGLYIFQGVWQIVHEGKMTTDIKDIGAVLGVLYMKVQQKAKEQQIKEELK